MSKQAAVVTPDAVNQKTFEECITETYNKLNPSAAKSGRIAMEPIGASLNEAKVYGHLKTYDIQIPINFSGTLTAFENNIDDAIVWKPKETTLKVGNAMKTDHITTENGDQYRRMLVEASIIGVQNTLPFPVGVKFSGLPISSSVYGTGDHDVDIVLRPESNDTTKINLHINDWGQEQLANLKETGWMHFQKGSIDASITEKGAAAWTMEEKSPIMLFGKQNGMLDKTNTYIIPIEKEANKKVYIMKADVASSIRDKLMAEYNKLPFHSPSAVSAKLVRIDNKKWSDTKVGIGASVAHPALNPSKNTESVFLDVRLVYQNWKI